MRKITEKLKTIVILQVRGAAHSICNLKFNVPHEIPVVSHNGSNYDYHFIIKELANTFKGQIEWLGEICKTFSVVIEKEDGSDRQQLYLAN